MMYRFAPIAVVLAIFIAGCPTEEETPKEATQYESKGLNGNVRFTPVNIYLKSETDGIAAYQVEIEIVSGEAEIVGVEGSTHPGFQKAPYYDPAALMGGRIVIAAFATAGTIPKGNQRVATLHMRESGDEDVVYYVRTVAVADKNGKAINAIARAAGR